MSVFKAVDGKAVLTKVKLGERTKGEVEVLSGSQPATWW